MTRNAVRRFACSAALLWIPGFVGPIRAQMGIGTWLQQSGPNAGNITMTVEACCNGGYRLTYHLNGHSEMTMVVDSALDGADAPILIAGRPSGETMAIKRVDDRHLTALVKMNGKTFSTSKSTLSADGKTLTVENDVTSSAAGQPVGKVVEVWVKK
jgi:hypothetical protein